MISVDSHIRLAKENLIKLVKSMDNYMCFFFDLCIALFSWEPKVTGCYWMSEGLEGEVAG